MAEWPATPVHIGKRIPRLDGLAKASGKAKYPSDVRPEGTLFGVMLYSPYAHAKVKSIDISAAEKMPGVKAVDRDRQGRDDPPLPRRRHRRRRGRDRGAGPRRHPRHQGRVRGAPPRGDRGPLDGRGRARGLQGRQRPQGPQRSPRQARGRDGRRGRHDRGDLLGPDDHPRLPRVPRPDREVGRRGQAHRLGQHAGRLPDRQRPGGPIQDPAREHHRPDRLHGRRLRLEVRPGHLGRSRRPGWRR